MKMKPIEFAAKLNKFGVVQLFGPTEDPTLMTFRTYEGKIFEMRYSPNLSWNLLFYESYENMFIEQIEKKAMELAG